MTTRTSLPVNAGTAIVIGLGNIGSHLVPHVARMAEVDCLVLIDFDVYGITNGSSQAIGVADIGRAKTQVQADVVRRIRPELVVDEYPQRVEDTPLGCLRADIILACVDSRGARQYVNEVARSLGVSWIDAGVEAGSGLARVNVYEPGPEVPCLECAWDQRDYDALPQQYPCESGDGAPATAAPSSLGALAAALQAIECQKVLAGRRTEAAFGAEVLIDARSHTLYRTVVRPRARCRLPHSGPFEIFVAEGGARETTLGKALAMGSDTEADISEARLRVPMHQWVGRLTCAGCGHVEMVPLLWRHGAGSAAACSCCQRVLTVSGFDLLEELGPYSDDSPELSRSLSDLGLRDRDVVEIVRSGGRRYVEIGVPSGGQQT